MFEQKHLKERPESIYQSHYQGPLLKDKNIYFVWDKLLRKNPRT